MASEINIKIGGRLYPIEQLINKSVYASKDAYLYRNTSGIDKPQFVVKKGLYIGKIFSWVQKNGQLYAMFNTTQPDILSKYPAGSFYVKFSDINESEIKQQGGKTSEEIQKEAEEKEKSENQTLTDKALESAKDIFKIGIVVYAGTKIITSLLGGKN